MSDRLPCINPRCRRTFKRKPEEPDVVEVICGKCWRVLPVSLTRRYRALRARDRRIGRLARRKRSKAVPRGTAWQLAIMAEQTDRLHGHTWQQIRDFFRPADKPAGLDAFLEEMGL